MFILLVTGILTLAFNIQPAKASGTIYIRADGSIDPPTVPISTVDNITYTFTGDVINNSIVVERDNIVVDGAGYTVQGTGSTGYEQSKGIVISMRSNITIKNTRIAGFQYGVYTYPSLVSSMLLNNTITENYDGVWLSVSSNNTISGNNVVNNGWGISFDSSSNNTISGNNITANNYYGIWLVDSGSNSISGNYITNNGGDGIWLESSSGNIVSGNNITANNRDGILLYNSSSYNSISGNYLTANNGDGVWLFSSSSNSIFHNNFINNAEQVYSSGSVNVWDNGYPSGGNYWSDYTGVDLCKGPYQNETGSDGIGDTQYSIDLDNADRYPLMNLWVRLRGDINGDRIVDIYDAILLANAYNSTPGKANWNPDADINEDNIVDIYDAILLANHYNQRYP
jgi:parallel beta-helix repeat protein